MVWAVRSPPSGWPAARSVVGLTQGGPGLSSQVPSMYIYEKLFVGGLAQGTAASSMLLLATAIILIPWIVVEFGKKKTG